MNWNSTPTSKDVANERNNKKHRHRNMPFMFRRRGSHILLDSLETIKWENEHVNDKWLNTKKM
jgi:hypothetical protein